MPQAQTTNFDLFLSHAAEDAPFVRELAKRLAETPHDLQCWLDYYQLVPGDRYVQEIPKALDEARGCAIFVGQQTPDGWFQEEIELAINCCMRDPSFRLFAVLIPGGEPASLSGYPSIRSFCDLRRGLEDSYGIHHLTCSARGQKPDPKFADSPMARNRSMTASKLREVSRLADLAGSVAPVVDKEMHIEIIRQHISQWGSFE